MNRFWRFARISGMFRRGTYAEITAPVEGSEIDAGADLTVTLDIDTNVTNFLSNPGFETAGGGGADVFANWSEAPVGGVITQDATTVHSGSYSCKIDQTGGGSFGNVSQVSSPTKYIAAWSGWSYGDGSNAGSFYIVGTGVTTVNQSTPVAASWAMSDGIVDISALSGNLAFRVYGTGGSAGVIIGDDVALSEPICLDVRRTDDDNKWHLVVDTNGRPVLYERISGTDTPRISGVDGDVSNGDTVEIICSGDDYTLNVGGVEIGTYNGASAQSTAAIVYMKQIGSGGAVSDLTADWS